MPVVPILPFPSIDTRESLPIRAGTLAAKDQRLINCYPEVILNHATQQKTLSLKKRPGLVSAWEGPGSGYRPTAIGLWTQTADGGAGGQPISPVVAFWDDSPAETRIYHRAGPTYIGLISGLSLSELVRHIDLTIIGGYGINVFSAGRTVISTTSAYFYPYTTYPSAPEFSTGFVGDTHTNTTIDGIADTSSFYVGQLLSGHADIAAGTRIASIDSANSITTTIATTGTTVGAGIVRSILAKIIDADFPTTQTGGVAFLDGRAYVMTRAGVIHGSDLNSLWSWDASNTITANAVPDPGIGVIRIGDEIAAFSRTSIEFFFNNGNASGSVLSVVRGATKNIGCASEYSYCRVGDDVAFVSGGASGSGLWLLRGRQIEKISGNREDAILGSLDETTSASSGQDYSRWNVSSGVMDGQLCVFMVSETQNYALAYSMESHKFFEFSANTLYRAVTTSGDAGAGNRVTTYVINKSSTAGFVQQFANASLSYRDAASAADAGTTFTMTAILDLGDMGTHNDKMMSSLGVDADTQSGTSDLIVDISDDDYVSFPASKQKTISLSSMKKRARRLGKFVKRAVKLTHANDTGVRIRKLYADINEASK